MSEEVGLSASLSVNATGVKTGAAQATTSLQALQAEMVKTQAALGKETDTANIDRLQQKIVGLGRAIQAISKGAIKASDVIPPDVTRNVEQQANAINSATQSIGVNVQGLSSTMNRTMHGVADLFIAPGRAALIFANDIPTLVTKLQTLKAEQAAVAASGGKAMTSAQLLTQAFNPLGIGISLVTIGLIHFLPKLIEMASGAENAATSLSVMTDALKDDKGYSSAISNVSKLTEHISLAKDGFLDKERVVKEYNDTIGKTTGQVDNLDQAEQALIKNKDAYIEMMAQKAVASYAYQKAAEKAVQAQIDQLNTFKAPTIGDSFKGLGKMIFGGGSSDIYAQRIQDVKDLNKEVDNFTKIANDAETAGAKIAKAFGFNLFGDDKTDKVKAAKHIKDVTDVLAELNKAFADTDSQVAAHTLHIGDVAKKNLGEVTKAINDLIKMGIKPTDPIIQGLDTLQNHLKISTSNQDVINIQSPKIKGEAPKIDPKLKTGIQQYFDGVAKTRADAAKDAQKKLDEQNKLLQNAIGSSIVGLSEGIGTALSTGDFSGIFDGFKTSLGNAIQDFGKYIIEQAIILKVLKDTVTKWIVANPALAIAAGAALVALGAAIKSSISNGGKSSPGSTTGNYTPSGSFSGGGGYYTPSGYSGASAASSGGSSVSNASANIANNIAASMGTIGISGDFKINGPDLVASVQRTQRLQSR